MLNNVPIQISRSARLVTIKHPNAIDCIVWRKVIDRTSATSAGGLPTLGGLGVLDSEDEGNYHYEELGPAKLLFAGESFVAADNNAMDNDEYLNYSTQINGALIECTLSPEHVDYFTPDSKDLLFVMVGMGIVIPYEIANVTGNVNIPPYTRRYSVTPRADATTGIGGDL